MGVKTAALTWKFNKICFCFCRRMHPLPHGKNVHFKNGRVHNGHSNMHSASDTVTYKDIPDRTPLPSNTNMVNTNGIYRIEEKSVFDLVETEGEQQQEPQCHINCCFCCG